MQNMFTCSRCGASNVVGQKYCFNCGQVFTFNCPQCGAPVDNTVAYCPNCRMFLNWPPGPQAQPPHGYQQPYSQGGYPAGDQAYAVEPVRKHNTSWILIVSIVIIALAAAAVWFFMSQPARQNMPTTPPHTTTDNTFDNNY